MVLTEEQQINHRIYNKKYRDTHKQQIKAKDKIYRETHYEHELLRQRNWKNLTYFGKKKNIIDAWKRSGLIHENMKELYDNLYIITNNCNVCNCIFSPGNRRCLDHDHDTGLFRQILCNNCNIFDNWKKVKKVLDIRRFFIRD